MSLTILLKWIRYPLKGDAELQLRCGDADLLMLNDIRRQNFSR